MKKFFEECKAFALKGNMMDMAIGVIIGGAFTTTDRHVHHVAAQREGLEFLEKLFHFFTPFFIRQYRIIEQERFASKFCVLTKRGFAVILDVLP